MLDRWVNRIKRIREEQRRILSELDSVNTMLSHLIYEQARASPRFQEPKRLARHGFSAYSHDDEDGITEEIFRRIGSTDCSFVEFGAGDGLENCTLYLLLKGWRGVWIDGNAENVHAIERTHRALIHSGQLKASCAFITAQNVEELFRLLSVPREFDLLSIDIDNNDYWVWREITNYQPRVVVIEYNASFRDKLECVVPYSPTATWNQTNYFGASLKALETLGRAKG